MIGGFNFNLKSKNLSKNFNLSKIHLLYKDIIGFIYENFNSLTYEIFN